MRHPAFGRPALLAVSLLLGGAPAAHAQTAPGPTIYSIEYNGSLRWFMHAGVFNAGGLESGASWPAPSGKEVGIGWNDADKVFGGGRGIIYSILPNGSLKWYKHTAYRTGGGLNDAGSWDARSGKEVGIGWNDAKQVFSGGEGVIYSILPNGSLKWYRHTAYLTGGGLRDAGSWDPRSGKEVGIGWNNVTQVFSTGGGIIYAITADGSLKWYRHNAYLTGGGLRDAGSWDPQSGKEVGVGWSDVRQVFSPGGGYIYAVMPSGALRWFRHNAYRTGGGLNEAGSWDPRSGKEVGIGWASKIVLGF